MRTLLKIYPKMIYPFKILLFVFTFTSINLLSQVDRIIVLGDYSTEITLTYEGDSCVITKVVGKEIFTNPYQEFYTINRDEAEEELRFLAGMYKVQDVKFFPPVMPKTKPVKSNIEILNLFLWSITFIWVTIFLIFLITKKWKH